MMNHSNINVYTDAEVVDAINKIKNLDEDFKPSKFFKVKILEHLEKLCAENMNIHYLNERIAKLETEKFEIDKNLDNLKNLKDSTESKHKEIIEKRKEQIEKNEKLEKERRENVIKNFVDIIKTSFSDLNIKNNILKSLAIEFVDRQSEESIDLNSFLIEKGYLEKPINEHEIKRS